MISFFRTINFGEGNVTHVEEDLRPDVSLADQLKLLREDLLQVQYGKASLVLDVGWYPSFAPDGSFSVLVVRDLNWDEPIYQSYSNSLEDLEKAIQHALSIIRAFP